MNPTPTLPVSVLDPTRKPWTRTPDAVADLTGIVARQAAEQADQRVAARIADAVTAERDAADTRERELLDAQYAILGPLLARKTLPAYVAGVVPGWARERYESERRA